MLNSIYNNRKIYRSILTSCPLCGSDSILDHFEIKRYNPNFRTDRCLNCGFIFMNPVFKDNMIKEMYSSEYYSGKAEYSYYDERDAEKFASYVWKGRVKKIRQYVKNGNFLDVGCAFGGLLKTASNYFTPFGIDMSEYSGNYAKSLFGENIHIGSLEDHKFNPDFFSVITMIELLEHEKNPVHAVSESFRLLKKGGLLLIQTANMEGMQAKILKDNYAYYMPGHVSYFTKNSLVYLLKKTGFNKIKIFYPVEFGLMPKLLKSRYNFKSHSDYLKWFRISYYHFISKIRFRNFAATSSMVIYAIK